MNQISPEIETLDINMCESEDENVLPVMSTVGLDLNEDVLELDNDGDINTRGNNTEEMGEIDAI